MCRGITGDHKIPLKFSGNNPHPITKRRDATTNLELRRDGVESQPPRILFIDANDSFSNNIIALLYESLSTVRHCPIVEKIPIDHAPFWPQNDETRTAFQWYLSTFDAVVAGPGPGNPANTEDVGLIATLWSLPEACQIPVLGVCLGFQSMCIDAGANVIRLAQGRHGIVTDLNHNNTSLFSKVGRLQATHYHSLHVNIDHPMQTGIGFNSASQMWQPSLGLPRISPLAWDCSPPQAPTEADPWSNDGASHRGAILMAASIVDKPWWGVQYHPESICSGRSEAKLLITNWWNEAKAWNEKHKQPTVTNSTNPHEHVTISKRRKRSNSDLEMPNKKPRKEPLVISIRDEAESSCSPAPGHEGTSPSVTSQLSCTIGRSGAMSPIKLNSEYGLPQTPATSTYVDVLDECNESELDGEDDPPNVEEEEEDESASESEADTEFVVPRRVPPCYGGFEYSPKVFYKKIDIHEEAREHIVQHVQDILDTGSPESIVLESGQAAKSQHQSTRRFSIIGFADHRPIRICYFRAGRTVLVFDGTGAAPCSISTNVDFGQYWKNLKHSFNAQGGHESSPFWGGSFLCYGYEAALDTIDAASLLTDHSQIAGRPDIFGAVILRSVVIDHEYHEAWIQSIAPNDSEWVQDAQTALYNGLADPELLTDLRYRESEVERVLSHEAQLAKDFAANGRSNDPSSTLRPVFMGPSQSSYEQKVRKCQDHIAAGNSYELCLTAQTTVDLPLTGYQWHRDELLYRNLTKHNPAPFGAKIRLGLGTAHLTIFSSSPERFLSWDRGTKCEFRPIKGTLRKANGMTQNDAEQYFKSTKERAENLMITDLIRHDLYGVLKNPNSVRIPPDKLFATEEYSTVYQLVTVIEGRFRNTNKTGIDVLNASLPPGSMTGAPKKRSCELLQEIEEYKPRGLYSGVIGYDDVGGGGDFSVLIRAAVRWNDVSTQDYATQQGGPKSERWTIGAGGAVTALSDPTAEYNEMVTKRSAVLDAFADLPCPMSLQHEPPTRNTQRR